MYTLVYQISHKAKKMLGLRVTSPFVPGSNPTPALEFRHNLQCFSQINLIFGFINGGEGFDINLPVRYDLDVIRPNLGSNIYQSFSVFCYLLFFELGQDCYGCYGD